MSFLTFSDALLDEEKQETPELYISSDPGRHILCRKAFSASSSLMDTKPSEHQRSVLRVEKGGEGFVFLSAPQMVDVFMSRDEICSLLTTTTVEQLVCYLQL